MIISSQKELKEILRTLKEKNIFIIGCGKCAAKLNVGGEPEVLEMEIATGLIQELRSKCNGIHIMPIGSHENTRTILEMRALYENAG